MSLVTLKPRGTIYALEVSHGPGFLFKSPFLRSLSYGFFFSFLFVFFFFFLKILCGTVRKEWPWSHREQEIASFLSPSHTLPSSSSSLLSHSLPPLLSPLTLPPDKPAVPGRLATGKLLQCALPETRVCHLEGLGGTMVPTPHCERSAPASA